MFSCDFTDFGMTFDGAIVVITNASINYNTSGMGAAEADQENSNINISYRVYVSQAAYDANANPLKDTNYNSDTIPSFTTDMKTTAYATLKTLSEFSTNVVDI